MDSRKPTLVKKPRAVSDWRETVGTRYCPHCSKEVHRKMYERHRRQFLKSGKWTKRSDLIRSRFDAHDVSLAEPHFEETEPGEEDMGEPSFDSSKHSGTMQQFEHEDSLGEPSFDRSKHSDTMQQFEHEDSLEEPSFGSLIDSDNESVLMTKHQEDPHCPDEAANAEAPFLMNEDDLMEEDSDELGVEELDMTAEELSFQLGMDLSNYQSLSGESHIPGLQNRKDPVRYVITFMLYWILRWQSLFLISGNAVYRLLAFLGGIFKVIAYFANNSFVSALANLFPSTIYTVRKWMCLDTTLDVVSYVCCKSVGCNEIYLPCEKLLTGNNGQVQALRCSREKFGVNCNTVLFKTLVLKDGLVSHIPHKFFCYRSLINRLEALLQKPGLQDLCEKWRTREVPEDHFCDIFDGQLWRNFLIYKGKPFLAAPNNYALMLNIDWYQPYAHRKNISIGAMYMALLNLPREVRYRRENLILLGLIPAFESESKDLNTFLRPIVTDLQALWNGVPMRTHKHQHVDVRAAVIMVSCDIPATRKVCGFPGHSAILGCSKCMQPLYKPSKSHRSTVAEFEKKLWPKRSVTAHRRVIEELKVAKNATDEAKIVKEKGYKSTILLELSYFDSVRMHAIDPLHNLFLGTAKRMFRKWVEDEILSRNNLETMDARIRNISIASDSGRLPTGLASNWSSFTGNEWKLWTLVYSSYVLNGILPEEHLKVWNVYVAACQLICKPCVSKGEILLANKKFKEFGILVSKQYGDDFVTPNIHLHLHLEECLFDYGPICSFWLMAFERFNGLLSDVPVNHQSIEVQIMNFFLRDEKLLLLKPQIMGVFKEYPTIQSLSLLAEQLQDKKVLPSNSHILSSAMMCAVAEGTTFWRRTEMIDLPKISNRRPLREDEFKELLHLYSILYPSQGISENSLSQLCNTFADIQVGAEHYGSQLYRRSNKLSNVIAYWLNDDGQISENKPLRNDFKPGKVSYFLQHRVKIGSEMVLHILAYIKWFKPVEYRQDVYQKPTSVWYRKMHFPAAGSSFMPVQRLAGKFAWAPIMEGQQAMQVVCPLPCRIFV